MSLNALRKEQRIKIGTSEFRLLQKLPDSRWQLQNSATGEWSHYLKMIFSIGSRRVSCRS